MEQSVGLDDFNLFRSCSGCIFLRTQLLRQFEFRSSGIFVLSSLVSEPFSVNTQTFIGNIHFCINICMECTVFRDQLKMILFYV